MKVDITKRQKLKSPLKVIKIVVVSLITIIIFSLIIVVIAEWEKITEYFNHNDFLTGTMVASLGINFASMVNILFGIILKVVQSRIEKRKNDAVNNINVLVLKIHKLANISNITAERKIKEIEKLVDSYVSDNDSKE